ncbi:CvpA family protein [Flavobacterium galactosidilyticum]|uniref:CvpA family protein n=1 Tax=Flavobacterium galactosidilyticum TaxID=2893886 RepID=UPI001E46AAE5|nr:CvpA family protein [Flavobacterium sp. F-340]UFH47303.1 CvpA family protein [Flavobacterium sp. F-340]
MSFLDIIVCALLVFAFYKGVVNGLFVELASLISLVLGIYFAVKFSSFVKELLMGFVKWNPNSIQIVAFILTFIVVVIATHLLGKFLTGIANFAFLGWLNKLGGGFFRVLKTVLIVSIVFSLFEKINYNNYLAKQETLDKSIFFNPIQKIAGYIFPSIKKGYEEIKKKA